jgi:uncharacterized protein
MSGRGEAGALRFAGYAAIFDRVDRGGDVVRPGAFGAVTAAQVPLLWQHRPGAPIGRIEMAREDRRGLRVIGRVSRASAAGREAAAMLAAARIAGAGTGGGESGHAPDAAAGAGDRGGGA